MRQLSSAFRIANEDDAREPRFVLRIRNEHGHIWLTSHDDVSPDTAPSDTVLSTCIVSAGGLSQSIEPEKGFSTIGSITVKIADLGFTQVLRSLLNEHNDTINNNKADLLWGYAGLDVDDYALVFPYYVAGYSSDDVSYTIRLSDTQRLAKKSLFQNLAKTELAGNIGLTYVSTIPVRSVEGFHRIEHGPTWTDAPGAAVGYYELTGSNANGEPTTEYGRYTGIQETPPALTGVTRGIWGSDLVSGIGDKPIGEGNTELKEVVYLDLPLPKLILALLTGDLYGQPGATLPSHWHANVPADQVDLASFLTVGNDLWNPITDTGLQFEYRALEKEDAKEFIAREIQRVANLNQIVNQYGELSLRRFSGAPAFRPGNLILDYDNLVSVGELDRDASAIRNVFSIQWEYRPDLERFMRNDIYIDADSISRNNITSATYELKLRGARNASRDIKASLNNLAEGIRARFSEPVIKPSVEALLSAVIDLEIGDVVTLDLSNHPDYTTDDSVFNSFEVQSIQYDFLRGTAKLGLFGSDGQAELVQFTPDARVTSLTHDGSWIDITTVLTGSEATGTFTVTSDGNLPGGRYFYDGHLRIADGVTITINETVTIDAFDIDMIGSAKIDGRGRGGPAGQAHYFGGADAAQEGIESNEKSVLFFGKDRRYRRVHYSGTKVPSRRTQIDNFQGMHVTEDGTLLGLPDDLAGNGGASGQVSHIYDDGDGSNNNLAGGAAVSGGAGLCLICDNLFYDAGSEINLGGHDNNIGEYSYADSLFDIQYYYAGVSGFGWPGALLVAIKNPNSAAPVVSGLLTAKTGRWQEDDPRTSKVQRPKSSGYEYKTPGGDYFPRLPEARKFANVEWAAVAGRVIRIGQDQPPTTNPGITPSGPAELPTLSLQYLVNEPKSPLGNLVTVTLTADPPSDPNYQYASFGYRLQGQSDWLPVQYGIRNESTVTVVADGSTYEFRVRSVSVAGQVSAGESVEQLTVPNISPGNPDSPEAPVVPKPARLELVNRINDDEGWNQWKGPAPIIRWAKLSTTLSGTLISPAGREDLHLKGYRIRFFDADGEQVHETTTQENTYTYGLEKNRLDNGGTASRVLRVGVQALADTGFASDWTYIDIENPPPSAPANIRIAPGFTSLNLVYDLPTDVDFVGVDVFLAEGTADPFSSVEPLRLAGNTHTADGLKTGQQYRVGLRSVDQFGHGQQSAVISVSTQAITSEALGDITTPLTLDENGGRVVTNNSGFLAVLGAVARPEVSNNPLIFHAWNGVASPFWINASGAFGFGLGSNSITFSGTELTLNEGVSLTFTTNKSVTVGAGGDFLTIGAALEYLTRSMPGFKASGETIADITLLDGFEWREQLKINSLDLSWITIQQQAPVSIFSSALVDSQDLIIGNLGGSVMSVFPAIQLRHGARSPTFSGSYSLVVDGDPVDGFHALVYADDGAVFYAKAGSAFSGDGTQAAISTQLKGDGFVIADDAIVEVDDCTLSDFYQTFFAKNAKINAARSVLNRPSIGFRLSFNATAIFDDGVINECDTRYAILTNNANLQGSYIQLNDAAAGVLFSVGSSTLNIESLSHSTSNNTNTLISIAGGKVTLGVLTLNGPGGVMNQVILGSWGCYCTVTNILGSGYYASLSNIAVNQVRPEGIVFSTVI